MLALIFLCFAAAVYATPTASPTSVPAPGSVLMPYSLQGVWNSGITKVFPEFLFCYYQFSANVTSAEWRQLCQPASSNQTGNATVAAVVNATYTIFSPSVVACGQNQQIGQSYGVFGGYLSSSTFSDLPVCIYFTRIEAIHYSNVQQNSLLNMVAYKPSNSTACPVSNEVCCPAKPTADMLVFQTLASQDLLCASGVCNDYPRSSTCAASTNLRAIGLGMGIGGIGLLIVTGVLMIGISFATPQA